MVGRGLYEIVGWSFTEPALLDRLRIPADHRCAMWWRSRTRCRRARRSCARRCSARCSTRPGTTPPATAPTWRSSSPAPSTGRCPRRGDGPTRHRESVLADEHHGARRAVERGAERPLVAGSARGGRFLRRQGAARLAARLARPGWSVTADSWPFLHPGRSAAVLVAADGGELVTGRLRRRAPSARVRRMGPRPHGCLRGRPRQARGRRPAGGGLHGVRAVPAAAAGPRGGAARDRLRRRAARRGADGRRADPRRGRRVRRLHAASRWGRAAARSPCPCPSATSSRPSPTRTSCRCASGWWRCSGGWGASCVAEPPVQAEHPRCPPRARGRRHRVHRGARRPPAVAPPATSSWCP